MYKNFVKPQKAVQASAYSSNSELGGEFTLRVLNFPGKGLDSATIRARQTLAEFEKTGVSDAQVARYKAGAEAQLINGLSSVSGKVSQLAANQTYTGNPNRLPVELKQIRAVTKADVQRVYDKYLRGQHAVILSVVPRARPPWKPVRTTTPSPKPATKRPTTATTACNTPRPRQLRPQ